jgi:hypothetical protein
MLERILKLWCRLMHNAAMWPMHGQYICARCLREHPVPWEVRQPLPVSVPARTPRPVLPASASMDICA